MRFARADLVFYFNFSKIICFFRVLKRFLRPNILLDDRAPECVETIRLSLLKYMWNFEERVAQNIEILKKRYPHVVLKEIRCDDDLNKIKNELFSRYLTN
jgi:adenylate kinase family enzyme